MLPRLPLLGYRAAAVAISQLDKVTTPLPTRVISLSAEDAAIDEHIRLLEKKKRKKQSANKTTVQQGEEALAALADAQRKAKAASTSSSFAGAVAGGGTTTFAANPNAPLTISQLQSAAAVARFSSDLISHFHAINVADRTLWLQLKALALKVAPFANSAELVSMLEILARRSACGPLECKAFQLHLGSDVAALSPTQVLRFAAACNLCGAPLQTNIREILSQQGRSWTRNTALAPAFWMLADVVDQLQVDVRKDLTLALVAAVEQYRAITLPSSVSSSASSSSSSSSSVWPHCDRDTAFILFRLRSSGPLAISGTGGTVPKDCNPVYSETLLRTIRVDKLQSPRCAIFLLRALCLGVDDAVQNSNTGKVLAEDLCRLLLNNLESECVQSSAVLTSIVHSLSGDRISAARGVPSATQAGVEAALACLTKHQNMGIVHSLRRETIVAMVKILILAQQQQHHHHHGSANENRRLRWLQDKLKSALNRTIILTPVNELPELLTLADRAGIATLRLADFALQLMKSTSPSPSADRRGGRSSFSFAGAGSTERGDSSPAAASPHEIRRCLMLIQSLLAKASEAEQAEFLKDSVYGQSASSSSSSSSSGMGNNSSSSSSSRGSSSSQFSLVTNWSEIKSLPAPKIALYAAAAAKILFCDPAGVQSNAVLAPASQSVSTTSLMLGGVGSASAAAAAAAKRRGGSAAASSSAAAGFGTSGGSSGSFHSAASGATMTTSSNSSLDGGLVGLCSAQAEICQAHRGAAGLSASDAALLVSSTSMLPPEARSLVLRDALGGIDDAVSGATTTGGGGGGGGGGANTQTPMPKSRVRLQNKMQQHDDAAAASTAAAAAASSEGHTAAELDGVRGEDDAEEEEEEDSVMRHPLFTELVACTKMLEAQCTVNTSLELNVGADAVLFASAQQRLGRLLQAAHPAPFEFAQHPPWVDWVVRLISAVALHRLANFRLPLWMLTCLVDQYPKLLQLRDSAGKRDSSAAESRERQFRAMRCLYALSFFGLDQPHVVEPIARAAVSSSNNTNNTISPRGMLHLLRMLEHLGQRREFVLQMRNPLQTRTEQLLGEYMQLLGDRQQENATSDDGSKTPAVISTFQTTTSSSSSSSSSAGGGGSGAGSVFTTPERRRLFDVLCCAAFLDVAPAKYKPLLEHLYPFDTPALFPLPDAIFLFGVAAQKKRLSGFSLRVWRTLSMQLDKVTVPVGGGEGGSSFSSGGAAAAVGGVGAGGGGSSSSAVHQQTLSLVSTGANCIVSQTAVAVAPTFSCVGNFLASGGGSASVDLLIEKLKKLQPFDPLLLATVIRLALHPSSIKPRPALSQLLCGAFDFTAAESVTSSDLAVVIETFRHNNAQRVAVGLNQADAAVALAWEALGPRMRSRTCVSDELFLRLAQNGACPVKQVGEVIARRVLEMAKEKPALLVALDEKEDNRTATAEKQRTERDAVCKIVLSTFVKWIGHLLDDPALWSELKQHVLEPLVLSSDNVAEKESLEELMSL